MGEVFRARDTRLGRDVAIKVLPEGFSRDPDRRARFEREARAVAVRHPHIVALHDVGEEEGKAYAVTELLDGETLRSALRRGPLPVRKAIEQAVQIARGLAAAHEKGIIESEAQALTRETAAGVVLGTVGYMSPEHVQGLTVDGLR